MEFFLILAVICFICVVLINAFIGAVRGEHSRDTGSVFTDMFLRVVAIFHLDTIGHVLDKLAPGGWPRRLLYLVAVVVLVGALFSCIAER